MKSNKPPKFLKVFEYAYLGLCALFLVEAYLAYQDEEDQVWIMLGLALAALFMFFFRRRFRKNREG
jgi:LPXTG-motif cell wall-anchored protein